MAKKKVTAPAKPESKEKIDVQAATLVGTIRDDIIGIFKNHGGWKQLPEAKQKDIAHSAKQLAKDVVRKNEVATAKAEAAKAVAVAQGEADSRTIKAKAEAAANVIVAQSLSAELVQYNAIVKWDGKLPETMAGGAVPFVNIGGK